MRRRGTPCFSFGGRPKSNSGGNATSATAHPCLRSPAPHAAARCYACCVQEKAVTAAVAEAFAKAREAAEQAQAEAVAGAAAEARAAAVEETTSLLLDLIYLGSVSIGPYFFASCWKRLLPLPRRPNLLHKHCVRVSSCNVRDGCKLCQAVCKSCSAACCAVLLCRWGSRPAAWFSVLGRSACSAPFKARSVCPPNFITRPTCVSRLLAATTHSCRCCVAAHAPCVHAAALPQNFDILLKAPQLVHLAHFERNSALAYAQHFGVPLTGAPGWEEQRRGLQAWGGSKRVPPAVCALLCLLVPSLSACWLQPQLLSRCWLQPAAVVHVLQLARCCSCTAAEEDLSAIVLLAHSVSMRLPIGAPISHAEALQHCKVRRQAGGQQWPQQRRGQCLHAAACTAVVCWGCTSRQDGSAPVLRSHATHACPSCRRWLPSCWPAHPSHSRSRPTRRPPPTSPVSGSSCCCPAVGRIRQWAEEEALCRVCAHAYKQVAVLWSRASPW